MIETQRTEAWNEFTLCFGTVEVTSTVVGFQRKALGSSEVISDEPLELPPSTLRTQAMWLTAPETTLQSRRGDRGACAGVAARRRARHDRSAAAAVQL